MMQQIMEKGKFNTIGNSYQTVQPQTRKRNHSLGSQPQSYRSPIPNLEQPTSYRKHRVQVKIQKFKALKAAPKMIQENISNYDCLKKEVTSKNSDHILLPALKKNPKLFVRNLGIDIGNTPTRKQSRPSVRMRSKTEGQSTCKSERKDQATRFIDVMVRKHTGSSNNSKQYHQLSLRQIVEESTMPTYRLGAKLSEMYRKKQREASRRTSDDYSLNGW